MTEQAVKLRIICEGEPPETSRWGLVSQRLADLTDVRVVAILEDGREVDISRDVLSVRWEALPDGEPARATVQLLADVKLETLGLVVESDVPRSA